MSINYPSQIDKICAEVIVEVLEAAKSPSATDADRLYRELCTKFDATIRLCEVERLPVDVALELLYPIAALADEIFITMPQYRTRWIASPLQLRYFGEVATGTLFFSRLEKLIAAPEDKRRQLELYFICLALGFKGKYGVGGQSGLRAIFENLGTILTDMRLDGRGASSFSGRRNVRKKILSLRRGLPIAFSLLVVAAATVYLLSLIDFLKFLESLL
jgi:type IV/VI secretion system ImpK/VasF family protein